MRPALLASLLVLSSCDADPCDGAVLTVTTDGQHWARLPGWDAYALGVAVEDIEAAEDAGYIEPSDPGCYAYGLAGYLCLYDVECLPGVALVGLPLLHELDDSPDNGCTGLAGPWGSSVLDTETGDCLGILASPRGALGVVLSAEPPL